MRTQKDGLVSVLDIMKAGQAGCSPRIHYYRRHNVIGNLGPVWSRILVKPLKNRLSLKQLLSSRAVSELAPLAWLI